MVYKRRDRGETWYLRPTLPKPFGRIGPFAGGTDRRIAEAMDVMLQQLALSRPAAIEALVDGKFTVRDLYVAHVRTQSGGKKDFVGELIEQATDPALAEAIDEYLPLCRDKRTAKGLERLRALAPEVAAGKAKRKGGKPKSLRLSWLQGKNITALLDAELDRGVKPNSVYRGLYRAVVELLKHNFGDVGRRQRMDGVRMPHEDDSRLVQVEPEQLRALMEALDAEARLHVLALALTAIDVKPLGAVIVRQFDEAEGSVRVPDRKTTSRPRMLLLSSLAQTVFRLAAAGKGPNEKLFPLSRETLYGRFKAAREKVGLDEIPIDMERTTMSALRLKDLRHLMPTALDALGVEREKIQEYMGHAKGSKETRRYITPRGDREVLDRATELLGLGTILRAG